MIGDPKESDWKRFRDKAEELRERYLAETNPRLVAMLIDPVKTPTERFWDTFEEMKKEKRILEDCLDGHSRSKMFGFMCSMLRCGMLKEEDLNEFSEELREQLIAVVGGSR